MLGLVVDAIVEGYILDTHSTPALALLLLEKIYTPPKPRPKRPFSARIQLEVKATQLPVVRGACSALLHIYYHWALLDCGEWGRGDVVLAVLALPNNPNNILIVAANIESDAGLLLGEGYDFPCW